MEPASTNKDAALLEDCGDMPYRVTRTRAVERRANATAPRCMRRGPWNGYPTAYTERAGALPTGRGRTHDRTQYRRAGDVSAHRTHVGVGGCAALRSQKSWCCTCKP